jgi:hypothetical protein
MLDGSFRSRRAKLDHGCKWQQRLRSYGEVDIEMHICEGRTAEAAAACRHNVAERLIGLPCGVGTTLVFVVYAGDSHLLHSGLKRGALHAQPGRSPAHAGNDPAGFAQDAKDVLPFQTF